MSEIQIKHTTKTIPGVIRNEIYEYEDFKYVEQFDDLTGKKEMGTITMYNGIDVCYVSDIGTISLNMPTNWVTNRKDMKKLVDDIERLDEFLAAVCENYK